MLKIPKSAIDCHIQRLELVEKLDILIPHELKEINLTKRIDSTGKNKSKTSIPFFCTHVISYLKATLNYRFLDDTNI